jgi:hypothetical protein
LEQEIKARTESLGPASENEVVDWDFDKRMEEVDAEMRLERAREESFAEEGCGVDFDLFEEAEDEDLSGMITESGRDMPAPAPVPALDTDEAKDKWDEDFDEAMGRILPETPALAPPAPETEPTATTPEDDSATNDEQKLGPTPLVRQGSHRRRNHDEIEEGGEFGEEEKVKRQC